jgi:homoserine/homoserine lactone efflux protein
MDYSTWTAYVVACFVISASPGSGAVFAMAAGLHHGYARAWAGLIGMQVGIALQMTIVGAGVGALLAASTWAFSAVKWLGVAYLVWLGYKQWMAPATPLMADNQTGAHSATQLQLFLQGFLVNGTNPKATIFLLAVLPQFLNPQQPLLPQYLIVFATNVVVDLIVMSAYVLFAATLLTRLREPRQLRWLNRVFGSLFMLAGAVLAGFKRGAA